MITGSWGEIFPPASHYHPNSSSSNFSSWWPQNKPERKRGRDDDSCSWSHEENKLFEDALAKFDKDTPDRWEKVAAIVPGKSVQQVMEHYRELEEDVSQIEAGCLPCSPDFDVEYDHWSPMDDSDYDYRYDQNCASFAQGHLKQDYYYSSGGRKRGGGRAGNSAADHERKKGIPWTEEEHRLFLLGLKKYGKGDWRSISRNFVITRTSTQVASHAQKYFIRLNSTGKDKRRSSIHDITTANLLAENTPTTTQIPLSGQFSAAVSPTTQPREVSAVFSPSSSATSGKFPQNCQPPWFFVSGH